MCRILVNCIRTFLRHNRNINIRINYWKNIISNFNIINYLIFDPIFDFKNPYNILNSFLDNILTAMYSNRIVSLFEKLIGNVSKYYVINLITGFSSKFNFKTSIFTYNQLYLAKWEELNNNKSLIFFNLFIIRLYNKFPYLDSLLTLSLDLINNGVVNYIEELELREDEHDEIFYLYNNY